ncbi:MAG: hypothetical protein HYX27_07585 [Acidobacteria bacterium]|nr:hypothetical protein [Acidobacteriota bacterium]
MIRLYLPLAFAASVCAQQVITTLAGTEWVFPGTVRSGLEAPLSSVLETTVDPQGRVVISDGLNHIVVRLEDSGAVTVIAGNGVPGFSGDNGDALRASLNRPAGIVYDSKGNLYIADNRNNRIRRVSPAGVITTYAGIGLSAASGDGGQATAAGLRPSKLAIDRADALYISELGNLRVRKVGVSGIISTVAGNGSPDFSGEGKPATQTGLTPYAIQVDRSGRIYISDTENYRIYRVGTDGILSVLAGTGKRGFTGDGGNSAGAAITNVDALALDAAENLYFGDTSNRRIRRITTAGMLSTVAGGGNTVVNTSPVPALTGAIGFPDSIAFDAKGRLFIANLESQHIVVLSENQATLTRVAGNGQYKAIPPGTPASLATMTEPTGIAVAPDGTIYYVELQGHRIVKIAADGTVSPIAGNGVSSCCSDNGPAANGRLSWPNSLAFGPDGALYIADGSSQKIRRILNGTISSIAGITFENGFSGDGGPATQAMLNNPWGVAVDPSGNVYFADRANHRVRKIDTKGVISTVAGNGAAGFSGDGGAATEAKLSTPDAVTYTAGGELLISDFGNHRIRAVSADGRIRTWAGTGAAAYSGDGGMAIDAGIRSPFALTTDSRGNVYIGHAFSVVRRVDVNGRISTVAGLNLNGFSGDGGSPANAALNGPYGLAVDNAGNIYIADENNNRIRVIRNLALTTTLSPSPITISAIAGSPTTTPARVTVGSSVNGIPFTTTVTYGQGAGNWLTVAASNTIAPATLTLVANASDLPAGRYTATINVKTEPAGSSNPVSVILNVSEAPARLTLSAESLSFSRNQGASADIAVVEIRNSGGGLLPYQAATTATWLKLDNGSGALRAGQVAAMSVTADPAGLRAGTYLGSITVTSGTTRAAIPVNLTVRPNRGTILVSQTGLTFTAVAGGGAPTPQKLGILNIGSGTLTWRASNSRPFVKLGALTGTVSQPWLEVSELTVSIQHQGLAAGQYYDQIQITGDADNSPQLVTVLLNVLAEGSNPGPEVTPAAMIFISRQGQNPGSQTVTFNHLGRNLATYDSSRLGTWYETAPSTGRVGANAPGSVIVQPSQASLMAGVRRGVVTFQVQEDGSVRTVNLLSVVAPPDAGGKDERGAASCALPALRVESTALRDGFSVRAGEAVTIEVRVADDCANPLTPLAGGTGASVVARPENGDPQVSLAHMGNGVWRGTWRPVRPAANTRLTVVALFLGTAADILANRTQGGKTELSGAVLAQGASGAPLLTAGGVVHAASFASQVPIAPGSLITLYGTRLADATGQAPRVPLPTSLNGTEVRLGDRPLPLLYTSDGQLNAQVPYDVPVDTQHQISVKRGDTIAVPETLTVATAQPGIFTQSQTGSGQGAIVKQDGVTPAEPGKAVARGEAVVIYCSGLGPVNPAVEAGRAAPSSPLSRVVNPVTVVIGGREAQVLFAGLAPGFSGLYQVNAIVPANAATGDAVEVTVETAGQRSRPVTISVR